jgi:hypothetical protein
MQFFHLDLTCHGWGYVHLSYAEAGCKKTLFIKKKNVMAAKKPSYISY